MLRSDMHIWPHETFASGISSPLFSSFDVSISFSQTDQLDVYLTHLPLSSFNQEHNTSQATFPFPHLSLSFSSPGSLLNHSSLPLLFSLSIPMNAQSPVQRGLSWGVGFRGHAHIRTPRCACTSADEQTPITGSDKKRDRTMKRGQAIMIRKECCFLCNMQNVTEIAVLLQLWIKQHKKKLKVHICYDVHELGASVLGIQKRNKNKHLYSYSNRKKCSGC